MSARSARALARAERYIAHVPRLLATVAALALLNIPLSAPLPVDGDRAACCCESAGLPNCDCSHGAGAAGASFQGCAPERSPTAAPAAVSLPPGVLPESSTLPRPAATRVGGFSLDAVEGECVARLLDHVPKPLR